MKRCALLLALLVSWPGGEVRAEGAWVSPGPSIPDVSLVDQDGSDQRLTNLVEPQRNTIINFFFTSCAAVCPTQIMQLIQVRELQQKSGQPVTRIVSVSLNPMSDTPDAMKEFARKFDVQLGESKDWLMLTGDELELGKVWAAFEQPAYDAEQHNGSLWIERGSDGKWTRVSAAAAPVDIVKLLEASP